MQSLQERADHFAQQATKEKAGAKKDALNARSKELGDFAIEARDILRRYRAGKLDNEA